MTDERLWLRSRATTLRRAASKAWPSLVAAGACVVLCGCPNPNAYTVPRTLEQGEVQIGFAAEGYGYTVGLGRPTTGGNAEPRKFTYGATPMLPTVLVRYGLVDGLELGLRVENFLSLAGDLKVQLHRGRVDVALDPGVQAMYLTVQTTDANGQAASQAAGVFYLHAPVLLGYNVSDTLSLVASPGIAYSIATNALPAASHAEQAGAQTIPLAQLGVGVDIRTSEHSSWHPELSCMKGFASSATLICVVGIALNIGAQPNYSEFASP